MSGLRPDRERLRELLRRESLMFGDFTLASGRKSRFYFDSKKTTLPAEAAELLARWPFHPLFRRQEVFEESAAEER